MSILKKNILFITWDGPQTSYMEGLFMPIFHQIQLQNPSIQFHCLQFTWGNDQKSQKEASEKFGIPYQKAGIHKKPIATLGSFYTLFTGSQVIKEYVKKNDINILMPRSNFPAFMINKAKLDLPVIFDADGLPLEERIDFSGMKRGSWTHQFLRNIEKKTLKTANLVITRSQKAIDYHLKNQPELDVSKFGIVLNGRDKNFFSFNKNQRESIRTKLKLKKSTTVLVYAGSFGTQYGWEEMLFIFRELYKKNKDVHFLFLTGSPERVIPLVPENLKHFFTIKRVNFNEIPLYLNSADIALAIRQPSLSMQGVAPIKLGEYLLLGLPTIASKDIGDSEEILKQIPGTYLFDHDATEDAVEGCLKFIENRNNINTELIRQKATDYFSLEKSAESYLKAINYLNYE